MRRKTGQLLGCARDSLVLGIELFNRPFDAGRVEGVLLFLNHAFEMLLKAIVLEKTGRIRGPRERYNYGYEKCVGICESQLGVLNKDEALVLRNLNGFRDAAAHDVVEISEGLLYGHAQSAVQIFATLFKRVFGKDLSRVLPRRVLPLATVIPTDIHQVVQQDMEAVRGLLGGGRRREDAAEARLRPYQVIEANIRKSQGIEGPVLSTAKIIKHLKTGEWKTALPLVGGLVQAEPGGIPFSIYVTKREGVPFRIDPSAPAAIAFRYVKPEAKYPYLTRELADKLGITTNKVVGFARLFGMRGQEDFHTSIKVSKTGLVSRYSERAREVIAAAIAKHGVEELWTQAKLGKSLNPADYC